MSDRGIRNEDGTYTCKGVFFALRETKEACATLETFLNSAGDLDDIKAIQEWREYIEMRLKDLDLNNLEDYALNFRRFMNFLNSSFSDRKVAGNKHNIIDHILKGTKFKKSRIIVSSGFDFKYTDANLIILPDNITFRGSLDLRSQKTGVLFAKGLIVEGDLDIGGQIENKLPDDIYVSGNIILDRSLADQAIELKDRGQIKGKIIVA